MPKRYLFYTLFLTTVFDAFSQLSGQLLGKRKLVPKISPNKTYEGLFGGLLFALFTAVLIHKLLFISIGQSFILGLGISGFAFLGDLLASYCKRRFQIKDFSKLIPGHGGILDRFDSFITAGAFMLIIVAIFEI
jgi:phosphatidate cytidylyltransferase